MCIALTHTHHNSHVLGIANVHVQLGEVLKSDYDEYESTKGYGGVDIPGITSLHGFYFNPQGICVYKHGIIGAGMNIPVDSKKKIPFPGEFHFNFMQ